MRNKSREETGMRNRKHNKVKTYSLVYAAIVVMLLSVVSVSFAWLIKWHRLNTVSVLQIPSKISITGANRSEMQKISLELTGDDIRSGNKVTIRRVFCIESTDDYLLEVAHTTNIKNMEILIFPVSNQNSEPDKKSGTVQGTDIEAGRVFYYDPDGESLQGSYLNKTNTIANSTLHDQTYASGDRVQQNAEPLYWLTESLEDCEKKDYSRTGMAADGVTDIHYRYYVLQLSWDVDQAETDIVYLLASHQN